MKVSLLLPISNNYFDADRAIISCLNQTYKNIEVLICLNGNTKNYNRKIVKRFKEYKKIKFFIMSYNNIVDALNFLISKSTGNYIARIDADDISKSTRIEKQVLFVKKKNIKFLSTNCTVISDGDKYIYNHKTNLKKKTYTNPIVHPSIFVKNKLIKKHLYRHVPFAEDYELYLRLQKDGVKFKNLNENLVFYRLNNKNISDAKRSFFLTISTLVVSKAFRENLEVNEQFFKHIKYDKNFKNHYKRYLKEYFYPGVISKFFYVIKIFFFSKNLLHKLVKNKIYYLFNYNYKYKKKQKKTLIKKNPLISIILPTYNSEKTIIKTLDSILKQSYKNFEVIIVDNSKDTKTIDLIQKKFKGNKIIKKIRIEKKILSAKARNIGVNLSSKKAELLAFCDADDIWKKEKLSYQINQMIINQSPLSCTNYDFYNPNSKTLIKNIFKIPFNNINFALLAWKNVLGTSSIVVEKNLFIKVKGFPESNFFFSFEDYFLWLKLARRENFLFIDKNFTIYRDDRKNTASKDSLSIFVQRFRIFIYYTLCLDLKAMILLIKGNYKLFNEYIIKRNKKNTNEEYFNML